MAHCLFLAFPSDAASCTVALSLALLPRLPSHAAWLQRQHTPYRRTRWGHVQVLHVKRLISVNTSIFQLCLATDVPKKQQQDDWSRWSYWSLKSLESTVQPDNGSNSWSKWLEYLHHSESIDPGLSERFSSLWTSWTRCRSCGHSRVAWHGNQFWMKSLQPELTSLLKSRQDLRRT